MYPKNPSHTGLQLAQMLSAYAARSDVMVVAVTPGAVPIALATARALRVAADYYGVSPILAPGTKIQVGAVAPGGAAVLDERVIAAHGVPLGVVQRAVLTARLGLSRSRLATRATAVEANVAGRVLVIVDEALATPLACEAAMLALQPLHPARVIIASPLGRRETVDRLRALADQVVCSQVSETAVAAEREMSGSATTEESIEHLLSQFELRPSARTLLRQAHQTRSAVGDGGDDRHVSDRSLRSAR